MRGLKVLAVVAVVVSLVAGLIGCGKKEVILKIGTNAEYPPFEYKENDEYKGIDIELAKMLAEKMGMKYEIVDMQFDSLIPSVTQNKIDMSLSAITITDERKQQIDFSMPYFSANQAIIVKKDSKLVISKDDDLAKFKIGVQNGTTGQIWIDDNLVTPKKMDEKKFKKYATNIEAITDMMNGNLDLVIIDDSAAKGYEKLKDIKIIYTINTNENYGIALPKNSVYKEKVNAALNEILTSEEWKNLLEKYLM